MCLPLPNPSSPSPTCYVIHYIFPMQCTVLHVHHCLQLFLIHSLLYLHRCTVQFISPLCSMQLLHMLIHPYVLYVLVCTALVSHAATLLTICRYSTHAHTLPFYSIAAALLNHLALSPASSIIHRLVPHLFVTTALFLLSASCLWRPVPAGCLIT